MSHCRGRPPPPPLRRSKTRERKSWPNRHAMQGAACVMAGTAEVKVAACKFSAG